MNYGKYFRLNFTESKVVEGIAVYDYIDLPAYFGRSKTISPQYPITVVITKDLLSFRLHYCAYELINNGVSCGFLYSQEEAFHKAKEFESSNTEVRTTHVQEIILEIPFNNSAIQLGNIISQIYKTRFPQELQLSERDNDSSYRGDYLIQLLKKRYGKQEDSNDWDPYRILKTNNDVDKSFSNIWLMDLQKETSDKKTSYIQLTDHKENIKKKCLVEIWNCIKLLSRMITLQTVADNKIKFDRYLLNGDNNEKIDKGYLIANRFKHIGNGTRIRFIIINGKKQRRNIEGVYYSSSSRINVKGKRITNIESNNFVGFLRKLFLDFMFDLAHSDVFQSSNNYNEMFAGLMKDPIFSSLMHKCNYYYYRDLTIDAIEKSDRKKLEQMEQVQILYATHLFEAEKQWVEDVINPLSDKIFSVPKDDFADEYYKNNNLDSFRIHDYWFAPPEEEMRRICFTTRSSNGSEQVSPHSTKKRNRDIHLCNADVLAQYLNINNREAVDSIRLRISQWFFKRYDFRDVLRLHVFKGFHIIAFISILAFIVLLLSKPTLFYQNMWSSFMDRARVWIIIVYAAITLFAILLSSISCEKFFKNKPAIWSDRIKLAWKRIARILIAISTIVIPLVVGSSKEYGMTVKLIVAGIALLIFTYILFRGKWVSNIHIFSPRLIASITAAWLTLAIGNELFSSFFDAKPTLSSCLLLSIVVFVFLLFEINRQLPFLSVASRVWRSISMLLYSYVISVLVGLFVINFAGERFLERSEYLPRFYQEYSKPLTNETTGDSTKTLTNIQSLKELSKTGIYRESDDKTYIVQVPADGVHPIAEIWDLGYYKFFILRDFLIQFAFLAMFIGVFIQMIFEEKGINEM